MQIVGRILPVTYGGAAAELQQLLEQLNPVGLLLLGVARGRAGVSLERVALNFADSEHPDNAGEVRRQQPLVPDAEAAHFCRLPLHDWCRELLARQIPCEVSLSAGAYVCNAVYFHALRQFAKPALFAHVPRLNVLSWEMQQRAVGFLLGQLAALSGGGPSYSD